MTSWTRLQITLVAAAAAMALSCGGSGDVGDECTDPGSEEQCVDGAVCHDRDATDSPGVCRLICSDDTDCPDDGSCEDVSSSPYKGCIPTR